MSLGGYSLLAAGDDEAVLLRKDLVKHVGQMPQYMSVQATQGGHALGVSHYLHH